MPLMQLDLLHTLNETFLIKETISIFSLWIFHLYVATFKQLLQMDYTSLRWNDVRLHVDRLREFSYPLSSLCHELILLCSVCTDCMSFFSSWLVTIFDIWLVVGVISMMNATCGTGPYLPSWTFVSISSFNGVPVAQTLVF